MRRYPAPKEKSGERNQDRERRREIYDERNDEKPATKFTGNNTNENTNENTNKNTNNNIQMEAGASLVAKADEVTQTPTVTAKLVSEKIGEEAEINCQIYN
jgi:hypothetical protein